jgi:hypothetical protein
MRTGTGDDIDLTAWMCHQLPRLTAEANRHRWAHKLDAALDDIRGGTPVAQALTDHHLPVDTTAASNEQARIARGDPGVLDELHIDPVAVTGNYTCPRRPRCSRHAQPGPNGHEPRCGVHNTTMILRSR